MQVEIESKIDENPAYGIERIGQLLHDLVHDQDSHLSHFSCQSSVRMQSNGLSLSSTYGLISDETIVFDGIEVLFSTHSIAGLPEPTQLKILVSYANPDESMVFSHVARASSTSCVVGAERVSALVCINGSGGKPHESDLLNIPFNPAAEVEEIRLARGHKHDQCGPDQKSADCGTVELDETLLVGFSNWHAHGVAAFCSSLLTAISKTREFESLAVSITRLPAHRRSAYL